MAVKSQLVIGIPSVSRPLPYLRRTIDSLALAITDTEEISIHVVIFNGETIPANHLELQAVQEQYGNRLGSACLSIISGLTKPLSEASSPKMAWYQKQVLDCAALMEVCQKLGEYYLHLEDDVLSCPGFISTISSKLVTHRKNRMKWLILSFYNSFPVVDGRAYSAFGVTRDYFGMIGQLFKTWDLSSLVAYLRTEFHKGPLDFLVGRWALYKGGAIIPHEPSLFQHIGVISSLEGRIQIWDTPRFSETGESRLERLKIALQEVKRHHPHSAIEFLKHKRNIRQIQLGIN